MIETGHVNVMTIICITYWFRNFVKFLLSKCGWGRIIRLVMELDEKYDRHCNGERALEMDVMRADYVLRRERGVVAEGRR